MQPPEIIEVDEDEETICCDGGDGPLGHPAVYYTFGSRAFVDCGYCGRRFVRRGHALPATISPETANPSPVEAAPA